MKSVPSPVIVPSLPLVVLLPNTSCRMEPPLPLQSGKEVPSSLNMEVFFEGAEEAG